MDSLLKNTLLACTLLATVLAAPVFAAGPVSLLQLQQTGGSLIDGDKKFSSFAFTGPTNLVNPAEVFVETVALPGGLLGLKFSGAMAATGPTLDFALFYTVETTNGLPLISEIGQSFVMSASGNGGFALIGETVFDQGFFLGNTVAQSTIGFVDLIDPAGEVIQGDQLIINPPRSKVWVTKDVNLIPNDAQATVGLSNIVQVFCQNLVVLDCPTNRTVGCTTAWNFDVPSATNACCPGPITITVTGTVTNQTSSCTYCATRTWLLTDACGNNSTCSQVICFTRDTTPPVITCPTNLNLGCSPLTIPGCDLAHVVATDDCGPVDLTCSFVDTTNGCNRLRTVVYTAMDQCSNRAACTQLITWIQNTNPPTFTICPSDRDLGCNPINIPGCNVDSVTVQAGCGTAHVTCSFVDGTNGCARVRTITYVAIDDCTNRAVCVQRLTWKVDLTPPVLVGVPTNRNFQCFSDYLALPPAVVTGLDDCDGTNVVITAVSGISGTCPSIVEICWTAIDQCSNSVRACTTYTIRDTIPPIIACPSNISVGCDTNVPPRPLTLAGFIALGGSASDNCDTNLEFFCFDGPRIGNQVVRTFTVCDDCTNCASCTQIITFTGAASATIVCPSDLTLECSNNIPGAPNTLTQFLAAGGWVSTTNVLVFTVATGPFVGTQCDGSLVRTYTITDLCSNTVSCQQHIFVRDTTPPTFRCGADKQVECGSDWVFDRPSAVDLCDTQVEIEVVRTDTNFPENECPSIFSMTRIWRATDICGNRSFCSQTVTIIDTTPPNLICRANKEVECGADWSFDKPTALDLCDGDDVEIEVVKTDTNYPEHACPGIYSMTRTWRATDTCGNRSFCNQTVTVIDTTPPNLICGANKEVECGSDWSFDKPSAIDLCDGDHVEIEVVKTDTNYPEHECPGIYSMTRTWRATDICGNRSFCNQTVTVIDTTPPNLICRANKQAECGSDWSFDKPTAIDLCDGDHVEIEVVKTDTNYPDHECPGIFSMTRTWRATDICGNRSLCNQTVTVIDTTPPNLICGANKQAECGADWSFDKPTAIDLCDGDNVDIEVVRTDTRYPDNDCPGIYSVTRIWRATDVCGNRSFCSQTVTVIDTTPPNLICRANKEAECGADWSFDKPSAIDLCDGDNVEIEVVKTETNYPDHECPGIYSMTRTWRATDICGNRSFCNQTVTVIDTTPPNLICRANKEVECGSDWSFDKPTAIDLCDGDNVDIEIVKTERNYPEHECPGIYSVTRTWRATDVCGNRSFCNQTVTVIDTTPPNLICGGNKEVECGSDWSFDKPTAIDLCDGDNVEIEIVKTETNYPDHECPGIYSMTRTWRATDICGNRSFCNQTVTVIDTTPPNLFCGVNKVVECGTDWSFERPTAIDLCDGDNVEIEIVRTDRNFPENECPGIYSMTRTWRATDICGNQSFCNQTVTVIDTTPPNLICGPNKQVECGSDWSFDKPTAIDLCDGDNVIIDIVKTDKDYPDHECPGIYSMTRTWRVTDVCGNRSFCNQTVTVIDTTPPNLICRANKEVECGTDWSFDRPTAIDLCDGDNVEVEIVKTETNFPENECPGIYSMTRTWRATDICGNRSFCNQTVTVIDTTPPNLICRANKEVECGSDWSFDKPTAIDLCDGDNVEIEIVKTDTNYPDHECPGIYSMTRTWRATDVCGNRSFCNQTVTVIDTTPPNLFCGGNKEVECGADWSFDRPTAIDLCDGDNVEIEIVKTDTNYPDHECPGIYSMTRTWRATDICGNRSFCNQTVTVLDTTPPNITCADDKIVECGAAFSFTRPTAVDACDGTNVVIEVLNTVTNISAPRCPGLYSVRRTWRASDICGNRALCSQTITIIDTTPPNLTCGPDTFVECGVPLAFTRPSAVDACDGDNVMIQVMSTTTNLTSPRCPGQFTVRRTWRAYDTCSNETFCSQTLTVIDTAPPNLTCAADQIVQCGTPFAFTRPTAVDACDGTNVVIEITSTTTNISSPRCPGLFTVRRTWRAYDTCSNETFCSQTIAVVDTTPPNLTCAHDQIVECGTPIAFTRPTAVDACDGTNVVIEITSTTTNLSSPRCPGQFTVRRTWRAYDTCSNETFCSQTITLVDTTPPNLVCARDQILECGSPFAFTPPTAVDACDGANVTIEIVNTTTNAAVPQCPGLFTVRRTWRVYDSCTNVAFCSQTITLLDTMPPTITCPLDRVVECTLSSAFTRPFAVDACSGTNVVITLVSAVTNTASPRCPNLFNVHVTWRAVDTCGNASLCSQIVRVMDTTPPSLTCAPDRFVECGLTWAFTPPGAVDGCDGTNISIVIVSTVTNATVSGCPDLFGATRTWRATDGCGNAALCSQTIEVVDTTAPELVCANNQTVQCGFPWSFIPPFAIDICDGTNVAINIVGTVTNAQCGKSFTATRTWRASDTCGNSVICNQTILVVDTVPPEFTCAAGRVIECGSPWNFSPPAANDICDGTNVVITILTTTTNQVCGRAMNATRTWSAVDRCGNRAICSQVINVVDTTPPVITCPNDRLVDCGTPWSFGTPSVTDVCDGTNVTVQLVGTTTNLLCGQTFTATRTWRAADQCGNNASCSQTITLVDTMPPNLACARNQSFECGTPFAFIPPTANDVCDGTNVVVTLVGTVTNVTCGNTFNLTRTWRATDACGNASSCNQTISVVDTTPPVLSCSPNRIIECGTPVTFIPPTGFDSCDGTNVTVTILSTTTNSLCGATFVAVRTWQVADRCGNLAYCSQTVRVIDSEPPALVGVPGNQFYFCFGDVPAPSAVTAFDLCDTNVTITVTSVTNGRCPFVITRCWTAVDDCGNSVQDCQSIAISPAPPVLYGPTNVTMCPGDPASFCAVISSVCPTTQQWYRDGQAIPGATNVCHTIPSVATTDAGQYCIVVSSACYSVTNCARLEVCQSALGDFIWNDINHNGIQEAGEAGVQDVMVQLYDCLNHPMESKPTDEFGGYLFTGLTAGTYRVSFALPAGYKFTTPNVGNDAMDSDADTVTGMTGCYTLAANETNRTVDAGIFRPGAIGDFVWLDSNTNGVQDALESGVPNVTVRLVDCLNVVLATTNTDATGYYLFSDLLPGSYKVTFVLPVNFAFTLPNIGSDDKDSDANRTNGQTGCYVLAPGETNRTVDAGLYALVPCPPATFNLTGNSAASGSAGNVRAFSTAGVTTRVSAFSRTTNGIWAPAYLGSYADGLGVTDSSESDGSSDRLLVDNVGRLNYVLFEFSQPIVVDRAYLDGVSGDSDMTVWIGNFPDPYNNHLALSDALLASFSVVEDSLASNSDARWALFNGGEVLANTLVIAAKVAGAQNDQFKISKLDICMPPVACAPALNITTTCVGATALGQPIAFSGTVRNAGNTTLSNIIVTHSIAGVVKTITSLLAGASTDYSGSFTPASCGSFAATITAAGKAACRGNDITATVSSSCSVPCPPDCPPATYNFAGNSSSSGTPGNSRTFTAGGVSVRATAFSRTASGNWATAYLGSYSHGLGVTDGSEGDGSNDRHVVDNIDRYNYVLFEFSQPVVVNRAYLDFVIDDSDITIWIGTFSNPYNNHLTLSDALLASFGLTEDSLTSSSNERWASFNATEVSGNTLVIAAKPGSANDQFKLSKLDICARAAGCAPALYLTTACTSAGALGQSITFSGSVSNSGNTTLSDITITHSIDGVVKTIASLEAGKTANYSGSFTPASCGAFAATISVAGKAACKSDAVTAIAYSTCTVPCAPACPQTTFKLTGDSASSGTAGNTRTFNAGGMMVRASAFSRTTSGVWAPAYLGSYSHGLGVTDTSEGDGSNDRHVVDNVGRFNYVLFEFNQPVVVNRAYLDHVISDSDITVWIGSFPDPFNNHLSLSDALLSSFAKTEDSPSSGPGSRWAMFNGSEIPGNTLVIAAQPGGSLDDQFKISKLDVCTPSGSYPVFIRPSGDRCLVEWSPAVPSSRCVLESTTSLRAPVSWSVVATNPPNPYVINNAAQTGPRFYRIRIQ